MSAIHTQKRLTTKSRSKKPLDGLTAIVCYGERERVAQVIGRGLDRLFGDANHMLQMRIRFTTVAVLAAVVDCLTDCNNDGRLLCVMLFVRFGSCIQLTGNVRRHC